MQEIKNVLLVGLGAIGTIYAVRFHDANLTGFRVLVDASRIERYQREGMTFNGRRYDFKLLLPAEQDYQADLILIATKADGLNSALELIAPYVGETTQILSLLNGISSEQLLAARYGWERVLYAFYLGHTSMRVGNQVTHDGVGQLFFGKAENSTLTAEVSLIKELFECVGIDYQIPADMLGAVWRKFMINVGFNQVSAVLRAPYQVLQQSPEAKELVVKLMAEVVALAKQVGIKATETMLDYGLAVLSEMLPEARSSMLQDVEAGRQTEVELFAGEVCRLGREYGLATPYNQLFLELITAIDARNAWCKSEK